VLSLEGLLLSAEQANFLLQFNNFLLKLVLHDQLAFSHALELCFQLDDPLLILAF
jgi:hypothetical protein